MNPEKIKQAAKELNINKDVFTGLVNIFGSGVTIHTLDKLYQQNSIKKICVDCGKLITSILAEYDEEKNNLDEIIKYKLSNETIYTAENNFNIGDVQAKAVATKKENGRYDLIEKGFKALTVKPKKTASKKPVHKTFEGELAHNIIEKQLKELLESVKNIENKTNSHDERLKALDLYNIRFELFNKEFKTFENDINNFAIKKDSSRFGFYCLLTLLSMLFYIVGSTSYFFFDAIVYPKLHAYIAAVSIPLLIIGIVIGMLYKPIFIKLFRREKRHIS